MSLIMVFRHFVERFSRSSQKDCTQVSAISLQALQMGEEGWVLRGRKGEVGGEGEEWSRWG